MSRKFLTVILVLFGCMLFCQPVLYAADTEQMSEGPHYDSLHGRLVIPEVRVDFLENGCFDVVMEQRGASNNWEVTFAEPSQNCAPVVEPETTTEQPPEEVGGSPEE